MSVLKDALAKLNLGSFPPGDMIAPSNEPVPYERAVGRIQRGGEPTTSGTVVADEAAVELASEAPPEEALRFAAVLVRAAQLGHLARGGTPEAMAADLHRRLVAAGKGTNTTRGAWTSVVQSVFDRVKVREIDGELTVLNGGRRPEARLTSKGVPTHDAMARDVVAALTGGWAVAHLAAMADAQARVKLPVLGESEDESAYIARCEEWAAEITVAEVRLALGGQEVNAAAWSQIYARRERQAEARRKVEAVEAARAAETQKTKVRIAQAASEAELVELKAGLRNDTLGDGPATVAAVLAWDRKWGANGAQGTQEIAVQLLSEKLPRRHFAALCAVREWPAWTARDRVLSGAVEVPEAQLLALPDEALVAMVLPWVNQPEPELPLSRRAVRVLLDRHGEGFVGWGQGSPNSGSSSVFLLTEAGTTRAPRAFDPLRVPPIPVGTMRLPIGPHDGHRGYARLIPQPYDKVAWAWVSPAAQCARRRLEASVKARGVGSLYVRSAMRAYSRHPEKNYPRLAASTARSTVYVGIDEAVGKVFDDLRLVSAAFTSEEIDPRWFLLHARGGKTVKGGWHIYETRPGQPAAEPDAVVYLQDSASGRYHKRAKTNYLVSERGVCAMTSFACEEAVRSIFFASPTEPAKLSDGRGVGYDPTGATVGAEGATLTLIRGYGTESEASPVAWAG